MLVQNFLPKIDCGQNKKNAAKRTRQHAGKMIFWTHETNKTKQKKERTKPYIEAACCLKIFIGFDTIEILVVLLRR